VGCGKAKSNQDAHQLDILVEEEYSVLVAVLFNALGVEREAERVAKARSDRASNEAIVFASPPRAIDHRYGITNETSTADTGDRIQQLTV
jgi:hypothetical protein